MTQGAAGEGRGMAELDRIRWRCRRGMLELELAQLLDAPDNDLWDWVSARSDPPDPGMAGLVRRLRAIRCSAGSR